jgi:hypothetical protein
MRSPLRKAIYDRFDKALSQRIPRFELFDAKKPGRWKWEIKPDLTFFVSVDLDDKWDRFYVGIAWSESGEFPWQFFGKLQPDGKEGRTRLCWLWKDTGGEDFWDLAPEKTDRIQARMAAFSRGEVIEPAADLPAGQLLSRVEPLVLDAMDKLEKYGFPFLRRVAETRGLNFSSAPAV